jgi:hypothetical protein
MNSLVMALILIAPVAGLTWWAAHNTNKELDGR